MTVILTYFFGTLMLLCALMMISRRNPIHGALWLIATFASMAAMFILMQAEFVAAIQLLVYAGGIIVLYMFVIMLVNLTEEELRRPMLHGQAGLAVGIAASVLVVAAMAVVPRYGQLIETATAGDLSIAAMATRLFTRYLLPFEVASVLLMAALVAAVYLAKEHLHGAPTEERP